MAAARAMWTELPPEDKLEPMVGPLLRQVDEHRSTTSRSASGAGTTCSPSRQPPESFLPITTVATVRAHAGPSRSRRRRTSRAPSREHAAFLRGASDALPAEQRLFGRDLALRDARGGPDHFIAGRDRPAARATGRPRPSTSRRADRRAEDTLSYGEPPQWLQPVRHTLGAVYLASGDPAAAERVYRADLAKWPANAWSLLGLAQALEAQGKTDEAAAARARSDEVWAAADAPTTDTSCLCLSHAE